MNFNKFLQVIVWQQVIKGHEAYPATRREGEGGISRD